MSIAGRPDAWEFAFIMDATVESRQQMDVYIVGINKVVYGYSVKKTVFRARATE